MGVEYAAFQAGTKVWFAKSTGGAWTSQLLVDAGEPLVEAPIMSAAPYGSISCSARRALPGELHATVQQAASRRCPSSLPTR
jgi:hypothetical protein